MPLQPAEQVRVRGGGGVRAQAVHAAPRVAQAAGALAQQAVRAQPRLQRLQTNEIQDESTATI